MVRNYQWKNRLSQDIMSTSYSLHLQNKNWTFGKNIFNVISREENVWEQVFYLSYECAFPTQTEINST